MSTEVVVAVLPRCDVCGETAEYDSKTLMGPWANLCHECWKVHTDQELGTGRGQRLILQEK